MYAIIHLNIENLTSFCPPQNKANRKRWNSEFSDDESDASSVCSVGSYGSGPGRAMEVRLIVSGVAWQRFSYFLFKPVSMVHSVISDIEKWRTMMVDYHCINKCFAFCCVFIPAKT